MEQREEEPPPFWLQSTAALRRADRRRRRQHRASSLFINTGVLVVLLLAAAVVFLAIVIPSVLSLARQVFNPSLVKKSWNSVNLILVLFAIVCGFLGKKDDDQTPVSSPVKREAGKSAVASRSPRQWYEYNQDSRMAYNSFGNADTMSLRRNSSSYPEMNENNRWRFYDDTDVNTNQFMRSESRISRSRSMGMIDENEIHVRNIEVDTGAKEATLPSTSPPPPPSRPHKALRKSDYVRSRDVEDQYVIKNIEVDTSASNQPKGLKSQSNPPSVNRPLPPPPPPLPTYSYSHQPLSPPSPISPTNYYWPPASPPPPPPPRAHPSRESRSKYEIQKLPPSPPSPTNYYWPPPPPPHEHSSTLPKKKHEYNRNWNDPTRESRSTYVIQKPLPPPDFLQPSSPPSPTNYFWPSPPPPPPPPPPMPTYTSTLPKWKHENKRNSPIKRESRSKAQIQTPSPPPPPPPPPPQSQPIAEDIFEETSNRKRGIVIRTLNRFPRRKRKQGRRSYENLEEFMEPPKASIHRSKSTPEFPPLSSPPPPPPPPPSMFHNIFSKKGKTKKKVHSISTSGPPAPPPPPPPSRPLPKTKRKPPATRRPLPQAKTDSFSSIDENIGNGSESPLIPIPPPPPPPPPPPFKMPPWRYVMQGDYVKLESFSNSPRSGYSASEDDESSPSNQKTSMASSSSSSSSSSVFCPSPDVNTKADDFITRFREKLTLEKNNSIRRQQGTTGPSHPIPAHPSPRSMQGLSKLSMKSVY